MFPKIFIILIMAAILFALGSALLYLVRDEGTTRRTVKALSWRIGLSLFLFFLLLAGAFFGWWHPHALQNP
ncbi:hypothetical protein Lgee_1399 [Legionella geestiana]|uniref:Uncharacterized protein n=1 Tax=Legionella geestiana TaxID=45065 RepID=A0A0W0TTK8_9GAMM|nr:twin transmembrane helix small protein [Legionella geestiana]KTC98953.1 hypothetical protein Lgee_1399 [Legionella geestiana]QBS13042.1 twin transmembrane helix small protein [Legionella geestiana]QDQ39278.1 twin transmembrane helix small protein [Legionella geestiana]STX54445.1 Protein of uncharacterised function (DUF2909) [Legionella geestiana]